METIIIALIIIGNFILQSTLFPFLNILNVVPNTNLILIVCYAINRDKNKSTILGFTIGILQDIIFGKVIGLNALIYMLIAYIISSINKNIFKENALIAFIFTICSTLFYYLMGLMLIYPLGYNTTFANIFKNKLLVELIYNSILSFFIYNYISKKLKKSRDRY
ncbi:MAG: rod shape-determining protein MreD [Clostridiales bacterium]|nr:rod shape-determining protein MreD [Clostridiales bacterium]